MPDLPGSSACLSRSAAPNHPGPPRPCSLVASERVAGFTHRGGLAVVDLGLTRPKRIRLRCGSPLCSPGLRTDGSLRRTPGPLHVERAINMIELSSTRQARLSLAHHDHPATTAQFRATCLLASFGVQASGNRRGHGPRRESARTKSALCPALEAQPAPCLGGSGTALRAGEQKREHGSRTSGLAVS